MVNRFVIFNQKGGVGKSTLTCNLAAIHAQCGLNTLIIDIDPQANSTRYLMPQISEQERTIRHFFEDTLNFSYVSGGIDTCIHPTSIDNLCLLPADAQLETLASKLETRHKIYKLRDHIEQLNDFDAIFIDTPPALNVFSCSALIAAHYCLVPFDCDDFSKQALYRLINNIKELQHDHNSALTLLGIVVNQYQAHAKHPELLTQSLITEGLPVLQPYLSSSVKVKESHHRHQPMVTAFPQHKLTQELIGLYQTIMAKVKQAQSVSANPHENYVLTE